VGLHYVGEMGQGMTGRRLFDFVTDGDVDWSPLPDVYDVFIYPDLTLKVAKGRANFERALVDAFPAEKRAIGQYFRDIKALRNWFQPSHDVATDAATDQLGGTGHHRFSEQSALQTTQQYLESHFRDTRLRAVLASQWLITDCPPAAAHL